MLQIIDILIKLPKNKIFFDNHLKKAMKYNIISGNYACNAKRLGICYGQYGKKIY